MSYPNSGEDSFGGQYGGVPYGGGRQYGGGFGGPPGPPPENNLVWAILVTVFSVISCNLISLVLGILAVVKSNSVNNLWAQGRTAEASEASRIARLLSLWGGGIIVVLGILWILGGFVYIVGLAAYGF